MYGMPGGSASRRPSSSSPGSARFADRGGKGDEGSADTEAARAADALRRAGGALPVADLRAALATESTEPLARCLRRRSDLFLLVERPGGPWRDQEWAPSERTEYERAPLAASAEQVVLVGGRGSGVPVRAPALLRESLLSMWGEAPHDDQIRRELARGVAFGETGSARGDG